MKMKKKKKEEKLDLQSITVLGEEYMTLYTNKYKNRKPFVPANHKKIYSFIPGTIREVFVKKDDQVNAGDKLLILEAMKMNNELISIVSGKVKKVLVTPGQMVSKNELLIEIE